MREAVAGDGGARAAAARPGHHTGHRALPCGAAGGLHPQHTGLGGDSDPPLIGAGVTAPPVLARGAGAAPSATPAGRGGRSQPRFVFIYRFSCWGGTSFVAVVGIFDESLGMRCWQRFCINISDNMFQQISSLKLFALFDKGRSTARNATGFMCSLLPTRRVIIRPVAPLMLMYSYFKYCLDDSKLCLCREHAP